MARMYMAPWSVDACPKRFRWTGHRHGDPTPSRLISILWGREIQSPGLSATGGRPEPSGGGYHPPSLRSACQIESSTIENSVPRVTVTHPAVLQGPLIAHFLTARSPPFVVPDDRFRLATLQVFIPLP